MVSSLDGPAGDPDPVGRRLAAVTLVAVVVRLAFVVLEPATHPVGDERTWTDWALNLCSARVHFSPLRIHLIFYPPVYPYFLAVLYRLSDTFETVRWTQALIGALLVPAVGLAGARAP